MVQNKCSICGGYFYENGNSLTDGSSGEGVAWLAKSLKNAAIKPICPDCRRAGYTADGGAKAAEKAREAERAKARDAERAAEDKRKKEIHQAALQEIRDYVFDDSSDDTFTRSITVFMDDYASCNPGLFADRDYKKVYKKRIEKELKGLQVSNPDKAEKLSAAYENAEKVLKEKSRTRLITSAIIFGGVLIAFTIMCLATMKYNSMGERILVGIFLGGALGLGFASIPQVAGKSKTKEEDV